MLWSYWDDLRSAEGREKLIEVGTKLFCQLKWKMNLFEFVVFNELIIKTFLFVLGCSTNRHTK